MDPVLIPQKLLTEWVALPEVRGQRCVWARWCAKKWGFYHKLLRSPVCISSCSCSQLEDQQLPHLFPWEQRRCSWLQQSFLWTHGWHPLPLILGLLRHCSGPSDRPGMLRRSKKVSVRETCRAPGFRANFLLFLFFLLFHLNLKKRASFVPLSPKYLQDKSQIRSLSR